MFDWFRKNKSKEVPQLTVDMHSHLLPGLDDGVSTFDDAGQIILAFQRLGYKRLITTPHVMSDAYRNTAAGINAKLAELQDYLRSREINMPVSLLTFGEKYLLFETNFITEPFNLKEFIFLATTRGYKLILAHPERYHYLQNNLEKVQDLLDRGVLMQMNISSLTGYYSRPVQQMAFRLIDHGMIHWLASDCHHLQHTLLMEKARGLRYFRKALTLPLLNNSLT